MAQKRTVAFSLMDNIPLKELHFSYEKVGNIQCGMEPGISCTAALSSFHIGCSGDGWGHSRGSGLSHLSGGRLAPDSVSLGVFLRVPLKPDALRQSVWCTHTLPVA